MKIWLITGCPSGFGQRLALAATHWSRVIATARNVNSSEEMTEPALCRSSQPDRSTRNKDFDDDHDAGDLCGR